MDSDDVVDLRSDTVTRPTPEMRRAMAEAQVGDDVYGEDPTVRRLEGVAAERVGHPAALFVPTGTMGNQVALHVHCRPGHEVLLDARSHILRFEKAALAVLSGLMPRAVETPDGFLTPEAVDAHFSPDDVIHSPTGAVALETTHNLAGGRVLPLALGRSVQGAAARRGVPVHLDGARLFNAAAALGVPAREVAAGYDSVMFCLSKGLGAPVGSLLCGSAGFVAEARKVRKLFGGGMRQAGVLAAAGLVALETMAGRLAHDHEVARRLARGLAQVPGLAVPVPPETNIVLLTVGAEPLGPSPAETLVRRLGERGVRALALGPDRVRFVTHYDLPADAVDRCLEAARVALGRG